MAIAEDVLETFQTIDKVAASGIHSQSYLTPESIGIVNPLRDHRAMQTLTQINSDKANSYLLPSREPAIARVAVTDASGATYLGMTCDASLPTALESLRAMFAEHWAAA